MRVPGVRIPAALCLVGTPQCAVSHDGRRATASSLYTFDDLRAGPVPFPPTEARIADLPVFRALGLGDGPAAILGNDLVANRTVVLAYSTGHLYLSAPR